MMKTKPAVLEVTGTIEEIVTKLVAHQKPVIFPRELFIPYPLRNRGVQDVTEAYNGLVYPRHVNAFLAEREERKGALTKEEVQQHGIAPIDLFETMMAAPHPLPVAPLLPRPRAGAREPRGTIGYAFPLMERPYTNILIPWYALVEGAENAARQFLNRKRGRAIRHGAVGASLEEREDKTFRMVARHGSFSGSDDTYAVRRERLPFGPEGSKNARLQEWLTGVGGYASCTCGDAAYRGRKNRWHVHPAVKMCKHLVSATYWLQAMGRHPFNGRWHTSILALPLVEKEGRRYSEALRFRRLFTESFIRMPEGYLGAVPLLTQSLLYGAIDQHLRKEGRGLFMPGIMTGKRLAALANEVERNVYSSSGL